MYELSERSRNNLMGVSPLLVQVVEFAIQICPIDFAVIEGRRTIERQRQLVAKGASQTMKSKHIEGLAVDLMAYIDDRASWEISLYDEIADAMKQGAMEYGVPIRWGAAWHIDDIARWDGTMQDAMDDYINLRRSEGKRPFIDAPHFEISA